MRRLAVSAVGALLLWATLLSSSAAAAPSSYSSEPGGLKVIYLLLKDLGYQVERIFDARDLGPKTAGALLIGHTETIAGQPLMDWVAQGGRLILAPAPGEEDGACSAVTLGSLTLQRASTAAEAPAKNDLALPRGRCSLKLPAGATLLAGESQAALALTLTHGEGQILVLASDEVLQNATLADHDLAVLLRRWLAQQLPRGARLAFFEQHQETLLSLVRRAHLGPLLLTALFWLALLYWRLAPRFGDASLEPQTTRRAFSQHARALGHLYQRQGAAAAMLKNQYERFLARITGGKEQALSASAALPSQTALTQLLATRTGQEPQQIAQLLAQVQQASETGRRVEGREAQRYYQLSRSLAALQRVSAPRPKEGGNRGRKDRR